MPAMRDSALAHNSCPADLHRVRMRPNPKPRWSGIMPEFQNSMLSDPVQPGTAILNESTKGYPLPDHPLRHVLNNELHARPPVTLSPPERISHLAIYSGEQGAIQDHADLVRLCVRYGITPPQAGVNHLFSD